MRWKNPGIARRLQSFRAEDGTNPARYRGADRALSAISLA